MCAMVTMSEKTSAIPSRDVKFSLIKKLVIGYVSLAFFTTAALLISAGGIYYLNRTARNIANNHMPVISAIPRLRNSLLAQESYAGKYAILKSDEFKELFSRREKEFLDIVAGLERSGTAGTLVPLRSRYEEYRLVAAKLFAGGAGDAARLRGLALGILDELDRLYLERQHDLQATLEAANKEERSAVRWAFVLALLGFALALVVAAFFSYRTFAAIIRLQRATRRIAEGDFDFDPQIPPEDEIGALAADFVTMAARLKDLKQISLDASPLTRLPGNIAIEREITRRLQEGSRFALCYADLDNFKSFTDHYGYIKGSEMIKLTGEIIHEVVKTHAGSDIFVGHVGGDDFVSIIDADKADAVCREILDRFDAEVVKHYTPDDLARGGIEGRDRYGVQRFFPIMTISIAVIINEAGQFSTAVEIAKTAAEIKDFAKEKAGSNYLINRRKRAR
jgi:GGDEF domain-containing protein